jgi:hypothetical protein
MSKQQNCSHSAGPNFGKWQELELDDITGDMQDNSLSAE